MMAIGEPYFYMVVVKGPLTVRHASEPDAVAEAKWLAGLYEGEEFVVLRSVCSVKTNDVTVTRHDNIPF